MRLRFDSVPSSVDNDFRVPPEIICAQTTIELSRARGWTRRAATVSDWQDIPTMN